MSDIRMNLNIPTALPQRGHGAGGHRQGLADLAKNVGISVKRNTKFQKFQRTYRDDRVAFVYDCIPRLRATFAPYQEEILANFDMGIRRQAVRSPHAAGKTTLAALVVHHAILCTEEDTTVPTLASVWRQLEKFLWPEIHKISRLLDWDVIGRKPYTRDELMVHSIRVQGAYGPSEAFAVASGDAASIEGAHASRMVYIFDESKSVMDTMWDAAEGAFASEGAVLLDGKGSGECYWLSISTPGAPVGRFYEIHSMKEGLEDWHVRHITLEEAIAAGRVGLEWVEKRKRQWGINSAVYKNRVLAQFATDGTEGIIPLDWIEAAQDRWDEWDENGRLGAGLGNRVIGVDAARYGIDKTVFAERINDRLENLYVYEKQAVPTSAGYLKPLAQISSVVNIEMDSGLGASMYDILDSEQDPFNKTMNLMAIYMGAGTTFMDSTNTFRFYNVRSAAWWNMRQLLDPNGEREIALYPSDTLLGDLAAPRYEIKYHHDWLTIFVESKDNIRKSERLGRSTDEGDATVLAFWDAQPSGGGVVF